MARGLGSPNMSKEEKYRIQSAGGRASGGNFKRNRARAQQAGRVGGSKSNRR
jgi:general stress protein YciG